MEYILTILVLIGLIALLGSHKYVIEWDNGKKETICRTFLSTPNARITTPGVPYIVEKQPSKTVILVDSSAANFVVRVGDKNFKVI